MKEYEFKQGYRINKKTGTHIYIGPKLAADPKEKELADLTITHQANTPSQKRLLKQIVAIEKAGGIVEVPAM